MIFFPVLALSITIAAALVSSRVVEAPFLSIKDRLSGSRRLALGRGGEGLVFPRAGG
jgi:hypothetical protein